MGEGTSGSFAQETMLSIIMGIIYVYDIVTLPIYYVVQRPWVQRRFHNEQHADVSTDHDDPSALVFSSKIKPNVMCRKLDQLGLKTMKDVMNYVTETYAEQPGFGTRSVLGVEDEVQADGKVFKKYDLGEYTWRTYSQLQTDAESLSRGLKIRFDLGPTSKLAILAETRYEWMVTAYAAFLNTISLVTLYTTLGNEGLASAVAETEVEVIVATCETLPKIKAILEHCPKLKSVLLIPSFVPGEMAEAQRLIQAMSVEVVHLEELLSNFKADETLKSPSEEDTAIIMYTSGSTGAPKGVILTHKNLICSLRGLVNFAEFYTWDRSLPFLPLAHVMELLAETMSMFYGLQLAYSSPHTLTDKSTKVKTGQMGDARLQRPTSICVVPLVIERICKATREGLALKGGLIEKLFYKMIEYKNKWMDRGFDTPILNNTLLKRVREMVGGNLRLMMTGGAPLSEESHSFIRTIMCSPLLQGYGSTETSACATMGNPNDRTKARVGAPLYTVQIKLSNWVEGGYLTTDKPYPRGEVHIGGGHVSRGYYNNAEETRNSFYVDSKNMQWFRTGDIGEVHEDGVLKIIDRKKDLVKLQNGEYISYGKVEAILKACPLIDMICVHALSTMSYAVAIVVVNAEKAEQRTGMDPQEAIKSAELNKMVMEEMHNMARMRGLERFEIPAKIVLTLDEWTPDTGLVTASMKIRRRYIVQHYKDQIDKIYF